MRQSQPELDRSCVNVIRFLSVDMVEKRNSGHPGLPLGEASMAYILWTRSLRHDPGDPRWWDRDRFVLSAGHGSALLCSLLHSTGYEFPVDQLEQLRPWGSKTPGHPGSHLTPRASRRRPARSGRRDGLVRMEISLHLAHDTRATIAEATRLRKRVRRDNLMT